MADLGGYGWIIYPIDSVSEEDAEKAPDSDVLPVVVVVARPRYCDCERSCRRMTKSNYERTTKEIFHLCICEKKNSFSLTEKEADVNKEHSGGYGAAASLGE